MEFDPSLDWKESRPSDFGRLIGPIRFCAAGENDYRFALRLDPRHRNSLGIAHGGVMMSLCDMGMGTAAWAAAGERPVATIDFQCHFLASARVPQMLHGRTRVLRKTSQLLFMSGDLFADAKHVLSVSAIFAQSTTPSRPRTVG